MVSMVLWVGKFSGCCGGSCGSCGVGGSGGFCSSLTWLALVLLGVGYAICGSGGGRLFVELAEVGDGWWWRSGMIGNMSGIGPSYCGMLVSDNEGGRMGSVAGYAEPIAWCG
jgi:hypothetical protein